MPKIDITKAVVRTTAIYPAAFQPICAGREKTRAPAESYDYPDADMIGVRDGQGVRFLQRSGEAY